MGKKPLDPVIGSFCASHGYIDEALGISEELRTYNESRIPPEGFMEE